MSTSITESEQGQVNRFLKAMTLLMETGIKHVVVTEKFFDLLVYCESERLGADINPRLTPTGVLMFRRKVKIYAEWMSVLPDHLQTSES